MEMDMRHDVDAAVGKLSLLVAVVYAFLIESDFIESER